MKLFTKNIRFVAKSYNKIAGGNDKYKTGDIASLFKLSATTAYGWLAGKHIPMVWTRKHMAEIINNTFGWSVEADDLVHRDLEKIYKHDIEAKNAVRADKIARAFRENIEKPTEPGARVKYHRKLQNMTLVELSQKTQKLFPDDPEYQVSHSYIATIEKGKDKNYTIGKMRGLATALGLPFEYLAIGKEYTKPEVNMSVGFVTLPFDPILAKDDHNWDKTLEKLKTVLTEELNE